MPPLRPLARTILEGASRVIFLSESYRDRALAPYFRRRSWRGSLKIGRPAQRHRRPPVLDNPPAPPCAGPGRGPAALRGAIDRPEEPARRHLRGGGIGRAGRKVRLTVVGQPAERPVVEAARACPLVELLPPRPMAELMPLYRAADVFLLPSGRETFGRCTRGDQPGPAGALHPRPGASTASYRTARWASPSTRTTQDHRESGGADPVGLRPLPRGGALRSRKFDWDGIARAYQALYEEVKR
jgi:hypothetical protein